MVSRTNRETSAVSILGFDPESVEEKIHYFLDNLYIEFSMQSNIDNLEVLLLVHDTNDHVPNFEHSQYTVHVVEEMILDDPIFVFQNHFFDNMNGVWRVFKFWSVVISIKD